MLKKIFLVIFFLSILRTASGQNKDTLVFYYKNERVPVASMDDADYFRMILPPDSGDNLKNIREYYKDGKIKFVGKFDPKLNTSFLMGNISLSGMCINYYPNGRKKSITRYLRGNKDGMEYLYYPNGQIYCTLKYIYQGSYSSALKWECYDNKGVQICKDGNGQWITYDDNFSYVASKGQIKKGLMDGVWHGVIWDVDSIKYVVNYSKGLWRSGIGYDRFGIAHSFNKERELTHYEGGIFNFIDEFKSNLHLPRNSGEKKATIDSLAISFTVEKNGNVENFEVIGTATLEMKNKLADAMRKCHYWTAGKLCGVTYRSKISMPLTVFQEFHEGDSFDRQMLFRQEILGF